MLPFIQAAGMVPDDCSLSGICALLRPESPIPSGIMYVAVGMVTLGMLGYLKTRNRRPET